MKKKLSVIDLFCGCGGFSQGFAENDYDVLMGIDFKDDYLNTFSFNLKNSEVRNYDLSDTSFLKELPKSDVVIAGPPCQGFSLTGPRQIDDPRNKLYLSVFKVLEKNRPKAFIVENVRGLLTMWNGKVFDEILEKFNKAGYEVSYKLLNSADYGVPQIRYRAFIVGIRKDLNSTYEFPKTDHDINNHVSCSEAIGDLPSLENGNVQNLKNTFKPKTNFQKYVMNTDIIYNHEATIHKKFVVDTIKLVPEGGNYKDLPEGVGTSRKFNEAWTRYHSKKPSRTIDTGHRNHFHYKWNRVPTIRENARLQSFKDSFKFLGTKTSQNIQVGNAVPPLLAFKIAKQLKKYL